MATKIDKKGFMLPEQSEVSRLKGEKLFQSPFERRASKQRAFTAVEFANWMDAQREPRRQNNITLPEKEKFIKYIVKNSKMLLKFNKIVIRNIFNEIDSELKDNAEQLLLQVETYVENGNVKSKSLTFVSEVDPAFLVFDMQNSLKVDLNSLGHLRFKLTDAAEDKVLCDQRLNLQDNVDNLYLENLFFEGFELDYKGQKLKGALGFALVFLPRNLEIAHMTLNRALLDANFERFGEIMDQCEDYAEYRKSFFPWEYLQAKAEKMNYDYFFDFNNNLGKSNVIILRQENVLTHSYLPGSFEQLKGQLRRLVEEEITPGEGLLEITEASERKARLGECLLFDMFLKSVNLVSCGERMLINGFLFHYQNEAFFEPAFDANTSGFQQPMIGHLNKALRKYLGRHFAFLQSDEKFLSYKLTMQIYLAFENNTLEGKAYPIAFSKSFIPLIIKTIQLNSPDLDDEQLYLLCANRCLNMLPLARYSKEGQRVYIDDQVIYFKLLMKTFYADSYILLLRYGVSFDAVLHKHFGNGFAYLLDTLYLNMFCDFKELLRVMFIMRGDIANIERFEETGFTLSSILDILFLIQVLCSDMDYLKNALSPENLADQIERLVVKQSYNLKESFVKIVELLDYLCEEDFRLNDFMYMKSLIHKQREVKLNAYRNFSLNLKLLRLPRSSVEAMIDKELYKDEIFSTRAQALFFSKEAQEEGVDDTLVHKEDYIKEDIYFEIAEDFEPEYDLEQLQRKQLSSAEDAMIFLNNLDRELTKKLQTGTIKRDTLQTIKELNIEPLFAILTDYFKIGETVKYELYHDMRKMFDTEKISIFRLAVAVACSFSESQGEITKALIHLGRRVTELFFPEEKSEIADEVAKLIVSDVYLFSGVSSLSFFVQNAVECSLGRGYVHVKSAQMNLFNEIIDISEICAKHLFTNTFVTGKSQILFKEDFCRDVELVFEDLIETQQFTSQDTNRFDVLLEIIHGEEIDQFVIPFKVNLQQEKPHVFCKLNTPISIRKQLGRHSLLPAYILKHQILQCPLFAYRSLTCLRVPLDFQKTNFQFRFQRKKETFLTATVKFEPGVNDRSCSNLMPWQYTADKLGSLLKFTQNELSLTISSYFFFLSVDSFYEMLSINVTELLHAEDVFKFVKLNSKKRSYSTLKGKNIEPNGQFFELRDYESAIRDKKPLTVLINFD